MPCGLATQEPQEEAFSPPRPELLSHMANVAVHISSAHGDEREFGTTATRRSCGDSTETTPDTLLVARTQ